MILLRLNITPFRHIIIGMEAVFRVAVQKVLQYSSFCSHT